MSEAKKGDTVKVNYRGTLTDGTVFDDTSAREPLEFTLGSGQVIPGFNDAVMGMSVGDKVTAKLTSAEAYGAHHEEMVIEAERDKLPDGLNPEVGQQLQSTMEDGQVLVFRVVEVSEEKVTLDANHPLAGQDLNFDIELVEIA